MRVAADGTILDIRVLAATHVEDAIRIISDLMRDPENPPSVRLGAAEYLVDRCYGKPAQAIHVSESGAYDDAIVSAMALLDAAVTAAAGEEKTKGTAGRPPLN